MTSQFPDSASLKSEIVVVKFTNFPPLKIEVAHAKEAFSPRLVDIEERCTQRPAAMVALWRLPSVTRWRIVRDPLRHERHTSVQQPDDRSRTPERPPISALHTIETMEAESDLVMLWKSFLSLFLICCK